MLANKLSLFNGAAAIGTTGLALTIFFVALFSYVGAQAAVESGPMRGQPTYTVTGAITFEDNGAPATDVMIVSSAAITAMTDADGVYILAGLPPGAHTLTPTYDHPNIIFEFEPRSQTVVVPAMTAPQHFTVASVIAVDYGIFGHIRDGEGLAIKDVVVTLNGYVTTSSDDEGNYRFFPVMPGEHELLAAKSGYIFLPAKRKAQVPGNLSDQDFVGFTRKRVYLPLISQ